MADGDSNRELPDLEDLVRLLRDVVKSNATVRREDVYSTVISSWNMIVEVDENEVDLFKFTSWCNLPFYESYFGWGKPVGVGKINRIRNKFF